MVITDPYVVSLLNPSKPLAYLVEGLFVVGVVVIGKLLLRISGQRHKKKSTPSKRAEERIGGDHYCFASDGTGGKSLGQKISQALNYAYFDKEKIIADIQKAGGPWASWEREMEACPTLWERFDRSFLRSRALVEKSVLEAAVQNNVVIVGRGANFILRGVSHAFHMRVVGPIDVRTEWIHAA